MDGITSVALPPVAGWAPINQVAQPHAAMVRLVAPPCPTLPAPRSDRCVLTVGVGPKPAAELAITEPFMRAYAERHGADFHAIADLPHQPHGAGYKYVAAAVAARYAQTLFLDADVLVKPESPSIFDAVPERQWGLVDDYPSVQGNGSTRWFDGEILAVQRLAGIEQTPLRWTGNTGVMLMPTDAAAMYFPPPFAVPAGMWCAEQHWASLMMAGRVRDMPRRWNCSTFAGDFWGHAADAHFLHAAGVPHPFRLELLRRWAAGNMEPVPSPHGRGWRPPWPINAAPQAPDPRRLPICESCPSWRPPVNQPDAPRRCGRDCSGCGGRRVDPRRADSLPCPLGKWAG